MAVASIFTELDIDLSKFRAKQQTILNDIKKVGTDSDLALQHAFTKLGVTADQTYQLLANLAIKSYERIAASAHASAAEQIRAKQSMIAKLNAMNMELAKSPAYEGLGIRSAQAIATEMQNTFKWYAQAKEMAAGNANELVRIEAAKNAKIIALENELGSVRIANDAKSVASAQAAANAKLAAQEKWAASEMAARQRSTAMLNLQTDAWAENAARTKAIQEKAAQDALVPWQTLGIRSTAVIGQQVNDVRAAAIATQATVQRGSQDWINIERAKNDKLKELNKEMVGAHEMSMASMTRAVLRFYAAYYVISNVIRTVIGTFMDGVATIDKMQVSAVTVAATITNLQGTSGDVAENYKKNLEYAKALVPVLMQIDAASFANLEQVQLINRAMAMHGVILDGSNKKQIAAATALTNTIAMFTVGQNKEQQATQETNALLNGEITTRNRIALMIDQMIKRQGDYKDGLKGLNAEAQKHGDWLERISPYLVGINAAAGDISKTWEAVKTSLQTTWMILQTEIFADFYKGLVTGGQEAIGWARENASEIGKAFRISFNAVGDAIGAVWGVLKGFIPLMQDIGMLIAPIAYGWGGVLAALKPIGEAIGNALQSTYLLGKAILDTVLAIGSLSVGSVSGARIYWDAAKKGYAEVGDLTKKNFNLLTTGVADSIAAYDKQYDAAKKAASAGYVPTVIPGFDPDADKKAVASAKAKYDALKVIDKQYFLEQEILLKSATLAMKAANDTEIDIAQAVYTKKLSLADEYYSRHAAQIAAEEKSRSEEDRSKLSSAEYIKEKTLGLDAEVHEKRLAAEQAFTDAKTRIEEKWIDARRDIGMTVYQIAIRELDREMKAYEQLGKGRIEIEELYASKKRSIDAGLANYSIGIFKVMFQQAASERNDIFLHSAKEQFKWVQLAVDANGKILDAEKARIMEALGSEDAYNKYRTIKEEQFVNDFVGGMQKMTSATETFADKAINAVDKISGSFDNLNKSIGGFSSGLSTNQQFKMTWDSYIGFLTPGVIAELDKNQAIIEWQKAAPAREAAAQKSADAAQKVADDAAKVAEDAAKKVQDITKQGIDLGIKIMELSGDAVGALTAKRMLELAAMDESLRPLQEHIYALEDLKTANEKATKAQEDSAKAAKDLATAQDSAVSAWKDSISKLVSQGQAIKDFLNTLGATGVSLSLSAARGAYMVDLAGARAGDATSYGRITQSAGAYITTAAGSNSELDQRRLIAQMKIALGGLAPVVELDANIELLKLIEKNTSSTATSVERLDVVGIKAIFDLSQVITFIANSQGIPDDLRKLITDQTKDYQIWVKAQLDNSSISETIKRLIVDGSGIYIATVKAALGNVDAESRKLALTASGLYITTVKAIMDSSIDDGTKKLALSASNDLLATVGAVLRSDASAEAKALAINKANDLLATITAAAVRGDVDAIKLGIKDSNSFTTSVSAILATDAETQGLKDLLTAGTTLTTIDGTMTWNPNDPMKSIWDAIKAATELTAANTGRYATLKYFDWTIYNAANQAIGTSSANVWYGMTAEQINTAIQTARPQLAEGGISSGPTTGYEATLHGTEAVVPLSGGRSIPVEIKSSSNVVLISELRALRASIDKATTKDSRNIEKTAKWLEKFDIDGIAVRV